MKWRILPACIVVGIVFPACSAQTVLSARKLHVEADRTQVGEGLNVVLNAVLKEGNKPISNLPLHAELDGKAWGAEYPTYPSGVAHLVIPMPERGVHTLTVTDGSVQSNPVTIEVTPRSFHVEDDPNHQIILEYETWFGPGYAQWGHEEATPLLGLYSSLDPRIVRQHALWFEEMGINVVELDWTNNLTAAFPNDTAKECIAATDLLLRVYATMPQHPKVLLLMGPENNLWRDNRDVYAGPWFKKQRDYVYEHYIHNPKFSDMFVQYEGKPLILYYLNGPRSVAPPDLSDPRFTTRYVGAWLQTTKEDKYGVWSWYDQDPIATMYHGKAEAMTVTNGYPAVDSPGPGLNNWLAKDAGGKNAGETYRSQWEKALLEKPHFLFINQWNEFVPPDQYDANLSNDMEPTLITTPPDKRASGWGFEYMNLTREYIERYHAALHNKVF